MMPGKGSPYGPRYEAVRAAMLGQPCQLQLVCDGDPADSLDHHPPLSRHHHIEGSGCCLLRPACMRCQTTVHAGLSANSETGRTMVSSHRRFVAMSDSTTRFMSGPGDYDLLKVGRTWETPKR
jgi:hypothetical protein